MPPRRDPNPDDALFPAWEVTPLPWPARSRLYHLAPIGVGTADVESLTGYLGRLAAAHSVTPFVLVRQEVAAAFPSARRPQLHQQLGALMGCYARRLNGVEPNVSCWTDALTTLTGRRDLLGLTFRPWAAVLPSHGLQRASLTWCPACYDAWRDAGQEIYQPLRWTTSVVTACARHHSPLRVHCPHSACQRRQPLIAPALRPGYCRACGHWLGQADAVPTGDAPNGDEAALAWKVWIAEAVGEMLVTSNQPGVSFAPGWLATILTEYIAERGTDAPLRGFTQLSWSTIRLWRTGAVLPSLESLLRFCSYLGTTPSRLLLQGASAMPASIASPTLTPDAPQPRRPRGAFDTATIRLALATALASDAPLPSLVEMARQLDCPVWALRTTMAEECRRWAQRRRAERQRAESEASVRRCAEVRRATLTVHQQGLYPNGRRVGALLSHPTDMIRRDVWAAWQTTLRDLGWQPHRRGGYRA